MMRILLTGASGQVGFELARTLAPLGDGPCLRPRGRSTSPIATRSSPPAATLAPGLIVNAAAYTAVDKAETETALAEAVNGRAPGILAGEARRLDAVLVHYSTDYVFDGASAPPVPGGGRHRPR